VLANNVVTILMIVFTFAMVVGIGVAANMVVPRTIERRRQRNIDQLVAGAELLADAISRTTEPALLARLSTNYAAHVRALTQLGQDVPALPAASLARAA
jgi:hypothetical protein